MATSDEGLFWRRYAQAFPTAGAWLFASADRCLFLLVRLGGCDGRIFAYDAAVLL